MQGLCQFDLWLRELVIIFVGWTNWGALSMRASEK